MKNRVKLFCSILFVCILTLLPSTFSPSAVYASVPNLINYQGQYTEYGQPVTGPRTMSFSVYAAQTGGSYIWSTGDISNIQVTNGIFNYAFSPAVDLRTQNLWLEISVNDKTLSPREQLTSNWYALHAMTAEDIEKSAGQNIHFAIGVSTPVAISSNGISILSGGILFPDNSFMVSAGSGSAVAISNTGDAVVNADAGGSGTGSVKLEVAGAPKLTIANAGNVVISTGIAVNGRIQDQTGYIMPVGTVLPYAGAILPKGWLLCDGSYYPTLSYPDLYNAIGTTYGGTGGSGGNFYVPNLQGRFPIGENGTTSFNLGNTGGSATITAAELPPHTHSGTTGGESNGHTHNFEHTHNYSGTTDRAAYASYAVTDYQFNTNGPKDSHTHTYSGTTNNAAGSGGDIETGSPSSDHTHNFTTDSGPGTNSPYYQPYLAVNYIIKY